MPDWLYMTNFQSVVFPLYLSGILFFQNPTSYCNPSVPYRKQAESSVYCETLNVILHLRMQPERYQTTIWLVFFFLNFDICGSGRAPEAWRSAHRHEQGVLDRHDPRGGQKHAEQSQNWVRDANSIVKKKTACNYINTMISAGIPQVFAISFTLPSLCRVAFCPQARHHIGNSIHPWERAFSKQHVPAQRNPATHWQQLSLRPLKSTHQITRG